MVPDWVPVIVDGDRLGTLTLIVRAELAVFAGGGQVRARLARDTSHVGTSWVEVGSSAWVTGTSAAFAYVQFEVPAEAGSWAYRLELVPEIAGAQVAGIGNVEGT